MFSDIINFINDLWKSKFVYLYTLAFFIAINIPFVNDYNIHSRKSWLIFLSTVVIVAIILIIIIDKRRLPKFKKNQYGIIFAIDIDDENQYNVINKKFVKRFQDKLCIEEKDYRVELLNSFTSKKFLAKYNTFEKKEEFLRNHRVKFIVFGNSVFGSDQEGISCKLNLHSGIMHSPMPDNNHKILQIEMDRIFNPLMDIEIYRETETNDFELNALQLNYAYEYILASSYLFSLKTVEAFTTFNNLKRDVGTCNKNIPIINYIKHVIDERVCFCANQIARNELCEYYEDRKKEHLDVMGFYVDTLQALSYPSYSSNLIIAIYYFLSERNISKAKKCIEECKDIKKDDNWKFSKVFLNLYQKDSLNNFLTAYTVYNRAFTRGNIKNIDVNGIFDSIIIVLEEEPEKKQLYFLLFLLNYYRGDEVLMREYFDKFKESYPWLIENENMRTILLNLDVIKMAIADEKAS